MGTLLSHVCFARAEFKRRRLAVRMPNQPDRAQQKATHEDGFFSLGWFARDRLFPLYEARTIALTRYSCEIGRKGYTLHSIFHDKSSVFSVIGCV
jgi:hypothetical protein